MTAFFLIPKKFYVGQPQGRLITVRGPHGHPKFYRSALEYKKHGNLEAIPYDPSFIDGQADFVPFPSIYSFFMFD